MSAIKSLLAASFLLVLAHAAGAATLTVNSAADDGTGTCALNKCTLRDAVLSAAGGDTVVFALPAGSTITLTNGELLINKDLAIQGPGASLLTVRRSAAAGTPAFRLFELGSIYRATISGLTLSNGFVPGGSGGAILNNGTLTVTRSTISGNTVSLQGGGILNRSTLTVTDSTISGNKANSGAGISHGGGVATISNSTISGNIGDFGGGIDTTATISVIGSTISGNTAYDGAGINNGGGTVTVTSSTIAGNTASDGGGGVWNNSGTFTIRDTIIAANTAPASPDVAKIITSQGFNLVGNNSGATLAPTTGDQIGTAAAPVNAALGPLQDNGGPTMTRALLAGSPAIDKGNAGTARLDQRGYARLVDSPLIVNAADGSDIGAFEVQADQLLGCSEINLVVNNSADAGAGSLRSVIANACAGSTVSFAANVRGAITLTTGELLINKDLTISGPGANLLTVQRNAAAGQPNFRIFHISSAGLDATISGLTIANGNSGAAGGGGIRNLGVLDITACVISGNLALNGGGLYNDFGTVTIRDSTLSGNSVSDAVVSGSGGAIFNQGGTVVVTNSTISGNTANGPGGNSDSAGGIITNVGTVTIANSTITGNSGDLGGGIRAVNGGVIMAKSSIIALNTSPSGPDVNGPLTAQGYNVIGSAAGATLASTIYDQVGVTAAQLNLGPLQDNGGPTRTHAPQLGSFAIDKGNAGPAAADQRGMPRRVGPAKVNGGDGADAGAVEIQSPVVVEFYNLSLDHYFITWVADEIAKLDVGTVIKGWARTGKLLRTYTEPQSGASPVCRYYIPPGLGDSHFFGRGTVECNATGQKNPSFVLEDPAFMQMYLPTAGVCPPFTTQVYRVFSNRPDANHRYMTEQSVRNLMAGNGWLVEGDGPDLVVMCAPA